MIGRRAFFSVLGAAPVFAKKAMEVSLDSGDPGGVPKPWIEEEPGFDEETLRLQSAISRASDRQAMSRMHGFGRFDHMKSWSKRFREDEFLRDELEERNFKSEVSNIIYNNSTSYLEKVAKLASLGVKVV